MLTVRRRSLGGAALAPVNTAPPAITGFPNLSQTLSVSTGTWRNNPVTFDYQWTLDGSPIGGETLNTYAIRNADKTHVIACHVTAGNGAGAVLADAGMRYDPTSTVLTVSGPRILGTLLSSETFTDADLTVITAHTGDQGQTYALAPGTWPGTLAINNKNRVFRNSTSDAHSLSSVTVSPTDFDLEFDFVFVGGFNFTGWGPGVSFRASNAADTCYAVQFIENTGASQVRFIRRLAGVQATIGSSYGPGTVTVGTQHHVLVRVRTTASTRMDLYVNDPALTTSRGNATDGNIAAAGQLGLLVASGATAMTETAGIHIDNLRVSGT